MRRIFFITLLFLLGLLPSTHADFRIGGVSITQQSFGIEETISLGGNDRGPALGVLKDGTLLLGGGAKGGTIYSYSISEERLKTIGNLISAKERISDSRFAITDIAVLSETRNRAKLLISYPRLTPKRCVEVVVYRVDLDRATSRLSKKERWFRSKPCVPISAVQHAAGRLEIIDSKSAYLTIGDLGYTEIDNRAKRGDLGSLFRITDKSVTRISQGHRNQQGIVLYDGKTLITSEHGPRGGDEINIIEPGIDYGWPFVTYGAPYSQGDYVVPKSTGTHNDYREPIKYWTPSIAPTELVQLPSNKFGTYASALAMGTLRQESLFFMKFEGGKIIDSVEIDLGKRIRDLDVLPDARLVATTDNGELLLFKSD